MRKRNLIVAAAALCAVSNFVSAAVIYSDDFNADTSANYNIYATPGSTGPSGDATFVYNYGAAPGSGGLSAPSAPTSGGSTTGLRVRTDNLQSSVGSVVGATNVITKNLVLPSQFSIQVEVWSNYIGAAGGIAASGTNGSTGVTVGLGTSGLQNQYLNVNNDGLQVEAFGDNGGGADGAYRVYPGTTTPRPVPTNSNYYAAGTAAGSATFSNSYYTSAYPSVSAPAGQSSFSTTQLGSTPAGVQGFAWHTWVLADDGTFVRWYIDNKLIGSVPNSAFTRGGSQVSLGNADTGLTGSSAANNQLFNAQIFDNLIVTDEVLPEPASLGLLGVAAIGVFGRRRRV